MTGDADGVDGEVAVVGAAPFCGEVDQAEQPVGDLLLELVPVAAVADVDDQHHLGGVFQGGRIPAILTMQVAQVDPEEMGQLVEPDQSVFVSHLLVRMSFLKQALPPDLRRMWIPGTVAR